MYCVLLSKGNGKLVARSETMTDPREASRLAREINRYNQDHTWGGAQARVVSVLDVPAGTPVADLRRAA